MMVTNWHILYKTSFTRNITMIPRNNHYFSVNRTLWHHINFNAVYESRNRQANENEYQAKNLADPYSATIQEKESVLIDA